MAGGLDQISEVLTGQRWCQMASKPACLHETNYECRGSKNLSGS